MRDHDVAINVHNEPYPSFENRVCLHLAAGHLVLSEPLSPTHGLEPGIDYVEFHRPQQLARCPERPAPHARHVAGCPRSAAAARPSCSAPRGSTRASPTTCWRT